ncbi:MAG: hypothetical protein FWD87_01130 [Spirochaetaceae bacterium]|nr:hypothetical protein [Spirochaetaceae bacterium]
MAKYFEKEPYELHYNREERLAMMPPNVIKDKSRPKGFFNNKSLLIIAANIILVCILFLVFTFLTRGTVSTDLNPGVDSNFNFLLNGYIFDNNILVSLIIEKKQDSAIVSDTPLPVEVTITLSDNANFYTNFFNFMPESPAERLILRAAIPVTNYEIQKNSILYADITYGNQIINLNSKIE